MTTCSSPPVRVYADRTHYVASGRAELCDILRPFWKDHPFSEEERLRTYGMGSNDLVLVPSVEDADLVVLPMSWNYYLRHRQVKLAMSLIENARCHSKRILAHTTGDSGVTLPFDDVYVLRHSGYRSRKRPREITQPVFFEDPISTWLSSSVPQPRSKADKPTVGFCGQAGKGLRSDLAKACRVLSDNAFSMCRLRIDDRERLPPSSWLRRRALQVLACDPRIDCNFVIRQQYRAGAHTEDDRTRTTLEFYRNVADSDYTLCLRGGGNFSKRLYETLAMGRIPAFVDTDCNLPFDDEIDWKQYCAWVDGRDLSALPTRILEHYQGLTNDQFIELQSKCRHLWQKTLTFAGFHRRLLRRLANLVP